MVVDDEPYIQELYEAMLPIAGHTIVDSAYNGQEAVLKFDGLEAKPDIILMDHRMPVKSGLDATREITAHDPRAKVLVISADASVQPRCSLFGAAGFLEKPFSMELLFKTIEATIRAPVVRVAR
jgi:two-component system, chemotaxis family, chemotaxis protein CheY